VVRRSEAEEGKVLKKKVGEARVGGPVDKTRPPQNTKSETPLPSLTDKGKYFSAMSKSDDIDHNGKPMKPKKLGEFDVYRDARKNETAAISKTGIGASLSEGLKYHIGNRVGLDDNVYRPGTREFFDLFNEARELWARGLYEATETEYELFRGDIGEWAMHEGRMVPLDFPMWDEGSLDEAKYKGRTVKLGAAGASKSGGRAHVYVRDPKTGNIKKVSFGSSMPDAMGSGPAAKARRKSFGERHGCADKNDKTKGGYWACRSTKLFGRNIPGWW
jgi:hypothetical protein